MSETNKQDKSPSSSASEHEASETDEAAARAARPESSERPPPGATWSIQVVSTAPKPRRRDLDASQAGGEGGGEGAEGGAESYESSSSSSSESEEDAEESAQGQERPSRRKSILQSIRARRPRKKVYAKPKDDGTTDREKRTKTKDNRSEQSSREQEVQRHEAEGRAINVQPSRNNYSGSEGDSTSDEEEEQSVPADEDITHASTDALTQLEMEEGQRRRRGGRESMFTRFSRHAGSFRIKLSNRDRRKLEEQESSEESDPEDLTGVFEMMSPESQPDILKKDSNFRRRANKAISAALPKPKKEEEEDEEEAGGLCSCFKKKGKEGKKGKKSLGEKKKKPPAAQLSPQLQKASSQGVNMMKKVFFPALPHLLQDAWVFLEFAITMFAFVFGLLSLDFKDGSQAFNITYFVLTIISIILAVIDCFIYFVQMGSCAECVRLCYAKIKKQSEVERLDALDEVANKKGCCRMSKEKKEKFNTYFELLRNIISEAILYPLLICDLFDFIVGGVFRNISVDDNLNFTLFVIGSLYLVLAVYVMRMFLIIGSLLSLSRLPAMPNSSGSQGNNIRLLKWFALHILFQVITHALLIGAVAMKIRNENPRHGEQETIFISVFLWIVIVLGGFIPIVGIISFFVTNYYYMREFSISFWIEMMSMLQAPSFTDTVFQSEEGGSPSDVAAEFVKDSELKKVKKQFERYKSPAWYSKFFFPLHLPGLILIGTLFVVGLFSFLASLILTQNPISPSSSTIKVILFDDIPITVAFFLCTILLMVFNVKIVILILVFFVLFIISAITGSIMIAVMLPFVVLIYFPVGLCVSCLQCCRSTVREVSIFEAPGVQVNYYNAA